MLRLMIVSTIPGGYVSSNFYIYGIIQEVFDIVQIGLLEQPSRTSKRGNVNLIGDMYTCIRTSIHRYISLGLNPLTMQLFIIITVSGFVTRIISCGHFMDVHIKTLIWPILLPLMVRTMMI